MASFTTMVRNITKSSTTETTDAQLYEFIKGGIRYTFGAIPTELLSPFAKDSTAISAATGYQISNEKIISVRRANQVTGATYHCEEVPLRLASSLTDTGSIMRASTKYPKYYLRTGKIYIKPDPSATIFGYVSRVDINGMVNAVTSTSISPTALSSVNVQALANPIVHYAAGLDYMALSGYWFNIGTDYIATAGASATEALGRAKAYISTPAGSPPVNDDALDYLGVAQEDVEMAGGYISAAAQEVNRALATLQANGSFRTREYRESSVQLVNLAKGMFEMASSEIRAYIESNTAYKGVIASMGGRR